MSNFAKLCHRFSPYIRKSPPVFLYILGFSVILIALMAIPEALDFECRWPQILLCVSDTMLILTPYLFLGNRWRITILIPVWFVTIYVVASITYYGWFLTLPNLETLWGVDPFDNTVTSNVRIGDQARILLRYAIIFTIVLVPLSVWMWKHRSPRVSLQLRFGYILIAVIMTLTGQLLQIENVKFRLSKINGGNPTAIQAIDALYTKSFCFNSNDYPMLGLVSFQIKHTLMALSRCYYDNSPSDDIGKKIGNYFDSSKLPALSYPRHSGNVLLLVVESLNSKAFTDPVMSQARHTPVLDSLLSDHSTLSALNVVPQVSLGLSSDGQLIYNTGLLPTRDAVFCMNYAFDSLYSLAEALHPVRSAEVIWEAPALWNHGATTRTYGYDELHSYIVDHNFDYYAYRTSPSRDYAVFDYGLSVMDTLPQPFYMLMSTMTMHCPFDDLSALETAHPSADSISGTNDNLRRYHKMLTAFDTALGHLLTQLKQRGIYDNTMIFIASDHHINVGEELTYVNIEPIMFMALNSPACGRHDELISQVDIFPTILHLTGRLHSSPWRGVGCSFLDRENFRPVAVDVRGNVHGSADSAAVARRRLQWQVSEDIITTDYFRHIKPSRACGDEASILTTP